MINLCYENQGTNTFLVYQLEENDVVDTMAMGMISNNKIYGVLPFIFNQMDNEKTFKYNTSSKTSLKQYFSGVVNNKRLLSTFSSLATAIMSAEEYMIELNMFIMDLEYIYVNVSTSEVSLICLPISKTQETFVDMKKFFKDIVFSVQFDQTENCDYVAKLITYLNGNINFSLSDFKSTVDNLIASSGSQTAGKVQPSSTAPVQQAPVQSQVQQPVQSFAQQQPPVQGRPIEKNTVNQQVPFVAPKDPIAIPNMNNGNSKQKEMKAPEAMEEKIQKRKGWLFFGGKKDKTEEKMVKAEEKRAKAEEKKAKAEEKKAKAKEKKGTKEKKSINLPFAVPGSKEPVKPVTPQQGPSPSYTPQNASIPVQPNISHNTVPAAPLNFGETTVLGLSNAGETTVLSQMDANAPSYPYLLRSKNGEKVSINKATFRLGKEKSYVDYFICDNTAISRGHASIITRNGEHFVIDNNSTNHTYINNMMIQSSVEVKIEHGAKLRLANEEFEFRLY